MMKLLEKVLPYLVCIFVSFAFTFVLTPLVREMNRRFGMVDKPDARRINKIPIPRGGGLAVVIGVAATLVIQSWLGDNVEFFRQLNINCRFCKIACLGAVMALVGYADDKFSLSPKFKLACQFVVAFLAWVWCGIGFHSIFPALPAWLDAVFTVFWIVGAINAFNLIDGLDGLASGLGLIAVIGMIGSLVLIGRAVDIIPYCAMCGALIAFLHYNYNPASVFLGDCGSMFIGFFVASLPLMTHSSNSLLVSLGVPMLAMGVPIFDTTLAILRRSIRHLLNKREHQDCGNDKVMTADIDHLHHRILRATGLNQRKAAWVLYSLAIVAVCFGLVGVVLESRSAGLWMIALTVALFVIFRDMACIELYDASRLISSYAHDKTKKMRRRLVRSSTLFHLVSDVLIFIVSFIVGAYLIDMSFTRNMLRVGMPVRCVCIFFSFVAFGIYRICWARALFLDFMRLFIACFVGTMASSAIIYYLADGFRTRINAMTLVFCVFCFVGTVAVRCIRNAIRDTFYFIERWRLRNAPGMSRILVYGTGLRYRAFRRELVRTAGGNNRVIVGLVDDDILLKNLSIGGIKVLGGLNDIQRIIEETHADAIVITCELKTEWKPVVRQILSSTGLKVSYFRLTEKEG